MPPKKAAEETKKAQLGRVGTNLKIGIVGIPNVGKSTFFNVLTQSAIPAENFPFCTINENNARCAVPDDRFDFLVDQFKPSSAVPAFLQVVDIAGLVRGAHEGQGLGNAFLSHIKAVDAIFHMVRVFDDEEITHVEGEVNPMRDMEIITEELLKKDLQWLESHRAPIAAMVARNNKDKEKKLELDCIDKILDNLREGKYPRFLEWNGYEVEKLNEYQLLTAKPVIYLVNMSVKDFLRKKNKFLPKIMQWVKDNSNGDMIIPFSAQFEAQLKEMDDEHKKAYLEETKTTSQLEKIIKVGYDALNLQYFFTAGHDEVKCWTIPQNTKAPQAAGRIHSDMENGFIKAEIMSFDDFKEAGSESACKAAGKYRMEGKNYDMRDGDIVFFKFNPAGGKKK